MDVRAVGRSESGVPSLVIRFRHQFGRGEPSDIPSPLLFHRFAPPGEDEALTLETGHPRIELRVWIAERRPWTMQDWSEQPPSHVGVLAGLDIQGELILSAVSDEEWAALTGGGDYSELGRRVVDVVHPRVGRVVDVFRRDFGQYWITPFPEYDSRNSSIGSYCTRLMMIWSVPGGEWKAFIPSSQVIRGVVSGLSGRGMRRYITREDWFGVPELAARYPRLTVADELLLQSRASVESGDIRSALIDATTSAEMSIANIMKSNDEYDSSMFRKLFPRGFGGVGRLRDRLIICSLMVDADISLIESAAAAIDDRNRVVHEGWYPASSPELTVATRHAEALQELVGLLLQRPVRIVTPGSGNRLATPERWEELYSEPLPRPPEQTTES